MTIGGYIRFQIPYCLISGCSKPHKARGLCNAHYEYVSRGFDISSHPPTKTSMDVPPKVETPLDQRFMSKVKISRGCWEWQGTMLDGYGVARVDGRRVGAHRVAYTLMVGDIGPGLFVCHHCDNKRCVRPDHLFVGTVQDNVNDYISKFGTSAFGGRKRVQRTELS